MRYENLKTHTDTHTQHYHQLEATKAHKATLSTLETPAGECGECDISTPDPVTWLAR